MKQPHGPKELGQEACASLGLSDDDQMSRLCPSLPTTHQMHRSDGGVVCYTPCSRAHLPGLPVTAQGWTWPPGGNDSQDKTRQEAATESFSEC